MPELNVEPKMIPVPKPGASAGILRPEEIAALIANAATEELPDTTVGIMEDIKPPLPDLSDPNRAMSPEDIAALIANM